MPSGHDPQQEINALRAALRELRWQHYHLFNVQRQRAWHAEEREKQLRRQLKEDGKATKKMAGWLEKASGAASTLFSSGWRGKLTGLLSESAAARVKEPLEAYRAWRKEEAGETSFSFETEDSPPAPLRTEDQDEALRVPFLTPTVDVVICIHNALEDLKLCLQSVIERSPKMQQLILVNDGSDEETSRYLETFAESTIFPVELIHNVEQRGYTIAANQGMRKSPADYVVLLNSDTIVTPHWLESLMACGESDPKIGIIGPLSNAASWQSVPERFGGDGDWEVNELPAGVTPDAVASRLLMDYEPAYPRVPLINGFCLVIKRRVFNTIGFFDEETFPKGYGEENDFCLRAGEAGFDLAVAENCYIFHAKSKSFTHEKRRVLSKGATEKLHTKHSKEKVEAACAVLRDDPDLEKVRKAFGSLQQKPVEFKVLFLLDFKGEGGGTHSIVQEANGLCRLGVYAEMAVPDRFADFYTTHYPGYPARRFYVYQSDQELVAYAAGFDVVVATLFTSVSLLKRIRDIHPHILPAYYIQDYEPLFYEETNALHRRALQSYELIPDMLCFAKTRWLCETVHKHHGVEVQKVWPSIDHSVYEATDPPRDPTGKAVVCAMVRPSTPRRSPGLTMRVLSRLKKELGDELEIVVFGCDDSNPFWETKGEWESFAFTNKGVLKREGVAEVLRSSTLFLDLSTYQAFGRTGLEAMACGCVPVLPRAGGTDEYGVDAGNCRFVDTTNEDRIVATVLELLSDREALKRMQNAAIHTADEFTITRASKSERDLFKRALESRQSAVS